MELARKPSNENVREALLFTIALSYYNAGEVFKAFRLLEEVTIASQDQRGKYNNIMAMWCLEQNEPERALGYLDYALKQDFAPANLTHAVALTEAGQLGLAYAAWDSLLNKKDTLAIALAVRMKNLLSLPADQMFLMSDEDKYALLRYRTSIQDSARFEEVLSTITSPDFQARSILDRSKVLLTRGYLKEAITTFKAINGLQLTNKKIFEEISILELLLLAEAGDLAALEQRVKAAGFLDSYQSQKIYLDAILAEAKGDTLTATRLFKWVGTSNPFFEEGLIAAANYFRKHPSGNDMFPYQILVEGVQNHPGSIKVRRAYTLEAARSGLSTFALNSLEALRTKLTPKEWKILRTEVEAILAERETD
jgi:hypothetical protein